MKYSEIITYKKIIKNIILIGYYLIILGTSYAIAYFTKNIILFFISAIVEAILFLPVEMRLEREIKEMEILLKLEKLLDRENNKEKKENINTEKIKLKNGKIDLEKWD